LLFKPMKTVNGRQSAV